VCKEPSTGMTAAATCFGWFDGDDVDVVFSKRLDKSKTAWRLLDQQC
jgi:hypothetical protein